MSDLPSEAETPINGAPPTEPLPLLPDPPPPKRHRRPSVRLGEIGDQSAAAAVVSLIPPHESSYARRPKQWKNSPLPPPLSPPPSGAPGGGGGRGKAFFSSKTRPLTNLGSGDGETLDIDDNRRLQPLQRRVGGGGGGGGGGAKRVRTNWGASSKLDEGDARLSGGEEADVAEGEEGWESPIRSADEAGAPPSETDGQDWKERSNNGRCRSVEEGGVRGWLSGLGLERYAPVFEIHEVDEEVLPLLTLEDLKDMGINAVGSRRKMFCAIQKLGKGF
ncbi:hypothetical protein QJS04_geneDACA020904 [Acorus gramineus]|uniref:SAM domain-containing protein n=1 Tax=Acorus gramineus TaxID=55184 RepID=A0AAV9B2Y1_ACOGR|nr:hypothetical protein QJS04_geneDACA020904 [Acorus gramineus]